MSEPVWLNRSNAQPGTWVYCRMSASFRDPQSGEMILLYDQEPGKIISSDGDSIEVQHAVRSYEGLTVDKRKMLLREAASAYAIMPENSTRQSLPELLLNVRKNVDVEPGRIMVTRKKIRLTDDSNLSKVLTCTLLEGTLLTVSKPCDGKYFYLEFSRDGRKYFFAISLINAHLFQLCQNKSSDKQRQSSPDFREQIISISGMSSDDFKKIIDDLSYADYKKVLCAFTRFDKTLEESAEKIVTKIVEESFHSFKCPLSLHLMCDPVVAKDGFSYERPEIQQHLRMVGKKSPKTNLPLESDELQENKSLLQGIVEAKEREMKRLRTD